MKFEALKINDSVGKEEYKAFLLQKFEVTMLFCLYREDDTTLIFDGWSGTEMVGCWYKAEHFETKTIIEFYETHYNIDVKSGNKRIKYTFPFPNTIDDFIADCKRCGLKLYYHMDALEKYKPINLLKGNDLEKYYNDILTKIGKI